MNSVLRYPVLAIALLAGPINAQPQSRDETLRALERTAQSISAPATARINALWLLQQAGALNPRLLGEAIDDADATVRKNALQIVSELGPAPDASLRPKVLRRLTDGDARVQIQAIIALGAFEPSAEIARAIASAWPSWSDQWIQSAAVGVAAKDPGAYVQAAIDAGRAADHESFVRAVVRQLALKGDATQAARLIALLGDAPAQADALKQAALETLAANLKGDVTPVWNAELQAAFKSLLASANPAVPGAALPLLGRWDKSGAMSTDLKPVITRLEANLAEAALSDDERGQVAVNLLGVRQMDGGIVPAVAGLLNSSVSPTLQRRVVEALGATGDPRAGQALLDAFAKASAELKEPIFAQLVKRPDWARTLVQALADHDIPVNTLGPAYTHRLRTHPNHSVAEFANRTIDALRGPEAKQKDELIAKLKPEVEKPGNLDRGHQLFTANCAGCHVFKDEGRNLAPNLTGMGAHGAADLLVHIVDPNRLVEPNFVSWSIETKDGEFYDGVIERENNRELLLRNASADYTIQQKDITSRRSTSLSLMPEGLDALGAEGLRDLLAYLCSEDENYRFIDLRNVFTADSTQGIYARRESRGESLLFKKFGVVKVGEVPFEILPPTKTLNGNNVIVLRGRNGLARDYPRRVEVKDLNLKVSRVHFLGGVGGWAWPFGGDEQKGLPVATITVTHANGVTQSWPLTNGVHIADYNSTTDVPGSKAAPDLVTRGQVRTFSLAPKSSSPITSLALESAGTIVAPTFVAITAELLERSTTQDKPGDRKTVKSAQR